MSRYGFCLVFLFVVGCQGDKSTFPGSGPGSPGLPEEKEVLIDPLDGTEVGNGGDLIQCARAVPNFPHPFEDGWYLLDYVENRGGRLRYIQKKSIDDYIGHIRRKVGLAAPELLDSFNHYLQSVPFLELQGELEVNSSEVKREWLKEDKVIEVYDEGISYIPLNCRLPKGKSFELHQAVVRNEFLNQEGGVERVRYSFDEKLIQKVISKSLQLSMLVFHEWLWDLYEDNQSARLRAANQFFHSQQSEKVSKEALRTALLTGRPTTTRPGKK